ncbi:helix-turn-helix transcriptional regulator [Qipengyuania sp. G39]|uniref:Helix-turn-helix transcriptional regulator n=1 Tax=Qipengyuania profundimaris TaxID=3067652 RepID=A0ABT9HSJ0_9SPHN|nr:helix-turn-helix transcriptional regulator [Qipengyuania sp. G39]MDP4576124.1 helix-turn-helix transcriptional regulator [Qipengyuania sp. G39]
MKLPNETLSRVHITPRQLECIEMVGEGMSSKEIGRKLGISHRTVEAHIFAVMDALDVGNRAAAVRKIQELESAQTNIAESSSIVLKGPATENYLIAPKPPTEHQVRRTRRNAFLPPPGGRRNTDGPAQRLIWITRITLIVLVVVNAIILSVLALSAMAE